jgi:hypothetical protein
MRPAPARKQHRASMKHPSNQQLFNYWTLRRGTRPAPERADIEPEAIRNQLADTFILAYDESRGHPFRVAGTRVCSLFGRELKDERFLGLWCDASRELTHNLLAIAADEAVGAVASASARTRNGSLCDFELLLLPLSLRGRTDKRVLGAIAPSGASHWSGVTPVGQLSLGTFRHLGHGVDDKAGMPTRPEGRIRGGFVVYDGGKSDDWPEQIGCAATPPKLTRP